MLKLLKYFSAFALVCLLTGTLFAQSSAGFGSISGVVQDPTGAVVEGAKVVVENASKGIRRELTTTSAGTFSAPALVPASGYHVVITKEGFASYEVKEIVVTVGETVTLNPAMKVAGSASQVEVSAVAPIIDMSKTDVSAVVTSKQILELPINGRRVDSFVLLTPGVTNDAGFGLLSFRGNPGGNTFLTDGNDTTNSFYNENAGRTRSYNISQDAVQEFQVVSSNFSAEYGRASGGVINTVTRSGTNQYHGSAYEFFRNRTLSALDPTANGVNPPEWRHQAGLSIGGPIKKDKLFFFWNGELTRRNNPAVSSNLVNNPLFDSNANYLPTRVQAGKTVVNCDTTTAINGLPAPTQTQCNTAIAYLQNRVKTQLVPRNVDANLLFGKIDYRPNEKHSFSFSSNYVDFRSPNGIQTQLSLTDGAAIGNNADTTVFNRTGRASWTWLVSPRSVNELRFGFFKDRQYDPASPSLLPSIGPVALTVQGVSNVGYATSYPRLNPSEQRFQLADTFSVNLGKHNLKFGADWDRVEDYVNSLGNQFGTYTYASLSAFAVDFSGNTTGRKSWQSFTQRFGNPEVTIKMPELGLFVQDEWKLTPKLTISQGIRYEYQWIPQPPQTNPAFAATGYIPNTNLNFAPRFGVSYAVNEKTVLRAGYGVFFSRYTTSAIENLTISNGLWSTQYSFNSTNAAQLAAGPVFGTRLSAAPSALTGSSTLLVADPNWRNPYSQQANIGIEREIMKNTSLSVSYVWSRGLHLQGTRDLNVNEPTGTCGQNVLGFSNNNTCYGYAILDAAGKQLGIYTTPLYTSKPNSSFGTIAQLQSGGNTYYNGLLVNLSRRYSNWFTGNLAYTWSHTIDDNIGGAGTSILFGSSFPTTYANGNYAAEKGNASTDQRHRLTVNAVFTPKFMNSDGFVAKYLVNNWQMSVLTIAASSQGMTPTIKVTDRPAGTLYSTLNGFGGSNRVPFEALGSLPIGAYYKTDARLMKTLPISERVKVNLGFEAFNIFNHLIPFGGSPRVAQQYTAVKQTSGVANGFIALVPNAAYGSLQQTQSPPDGTTARRAQAVVRINF